MFLENTEVAPIVHIDADCFYVSCEVLKKPSLAGKPVGVLSSQDACIVSKSYEAKAMGVTTGVPRWIADKVCPGLICIPADFYFYERVSRKIFAYLRTLSPLVDVYSIDEGFISFKNVKPFEGWSYEALGNKIKDDIKRLVGITVSVGVAPTKTLAKMASEKNKPNGLTVVYQENIVDFVKECGVGEIWGIGRNRGELLSKYGINTAYDFYNAGEKFLKKLLHKPGVDLWYELHGVPIFPLPTPYEPPKSISRTSSIGRILRNGSTTGLGVLVWSLLSYHAFKMTVSLTCKNLATKRIVFFIKIKDKHTVSTEIHLGRHTANYHLIITKIHEAFTRIYEPGEPYRKCGIIACDLIENKHIQHDIFGNTFHDQKSVAAIKAITAINKKFGSGTIMPGTTSKVYTATRVRKWRIEKYILECI